MLWLYFTDYDCVCIIGYNNLLITGIDIPQMTFLSSSFILHIYWTYLVTTWSNHTESFLGTLGWSKTISVTFLVLFQDLSGSLIIGAEIQPNSFIPASLQCCICPDEPTHFVCVYPESTHCKFHSSRMTVPDFGAKKK